MEKRLTPKKITNKMQIRFIILISIFSMLACQTASLDKGSLVTNFTELQKAIDDSEPGDHIVLSNGIWKDVEINFTANGTKENPIVLRAETAGEVFIEGNLV